MLYYYIEKNDLFKIREMLEKNPELLTKPIVKESKQTPLMRVCYNGNLQGVQLMIEMNAEVNFISEKG